MTALADEDVAEELARRIAEHGPITVADYMGAANAHYYSNREPFGTEGDFTTAPEISQMFGELAGLWLADGWLRAGRPAEAHFVELGPGRGTLANDALRAMRGTGLEPAVELVEQSPRLRAVQAQTLPVPARWHDDVSSLPASGPLLVIANEFFDALPVRQFDDTGEELRVSADGDRFIRSGTVDHEISSASLAIVGDLGRRLNAQGGAALIVDYGHVRSGRGDTLQAVSRHAFADPWSEPCGRDLTAHVDFQALAEAAAAAGALVHGPIAQGDWLDSMGIQLRAMALAKAAPDRAEEIAAARDRLIAPGQMGRLFKVLALTAPGWPKPVGFA